MDANDFNFSSENFRNLSEEEQKQFIHDLIHSRAAGTGAALFNPSTGQTVNVDELIEQLGEEAVTEMLMKALNNSETKGVTVNVADFKNLLAKAHRGECSEEELAMLAFLGQEMEKTDAMGFQKTLLSLVADLVKFAKTERNYDVSLGDIITSFLGVSLMSLIHMDGSGLSKYAATDAPTLSEMFDSVGEDIFNTWSASCSQLPDKGMIIMGLLHLVTRLIVEEKVPLSPQVVEMFSEDVICDEDDDNGHDSTLNICKPNTYSAESNAEDKEMRDLLKE